MRIALICTEMLPLPAIRGGSIEDLIDGMTPFIAGKHELTEISITDPRLPHREVREGTRYVRFPKRYYWQSVVKYLKETKKPFDLVHVFNRPRWVPVFKKAAPSSAFVLDLHNEVFSRSMLPDHEGAACINSVDRIVAVSNYLARTVTRRFPDAQSKLQTVYSGVDLNRYQPVWTAVEMRNKLRKQYGLERKKVILFTGRVLPKKGPHILIEALKLLLPRYPDTVLMVVGSSWYSNDKETEYIKKLRKMAQPLKEHIIFTNFIPQWRMHEYYLAGDVYVCPSQWQEPAGRVHFEAMAAGLPIVTVNRGGIPEIVSHLDNGLIIKDYRSPKAFAEAIEQLFANPELAKKMARRGRETAERRFGFERMAEDYLQVYEEAIRS